MRRRGLTLIELLLVLAVVAALALLVVPALSGSRRLARLRDQAREVVALTRTARARAAGEGRVYVLLVDGEARTLRLARRRDPLAAPGDGEDPELEAPPDDAAWSRARDFARDVELAEVEVDGAVWDEEPPLEVAFRPTGEADPVRIVLAAGADRLAVVVDGTLGLARVTDPDAEEEGER